MIYSTYILQWTNYNFYTSGQPGTPGLPGK